MHVACVITSAFIPISSPSHQPRHLQASQKNPQPHPPKIIRKKKKKKLNQFSLSNLPRVLYSCTPSPLSLLRRQTSASGCSGVGTFPNPDAVLPSLGHISIRDKSHINRHQPLTVFSFRNSSCMDFRFPSPHTNGFFSIRSILRT